ncbi:hypothetical protein [Paenibacillus elgii]|uniref:hypothetical protein n=1 Tax=Paenibacillus elgii TaxID=189691 RepID=UPI000248C79A|nr:hypothetical protein [Paenibacillus elgii]
MSSTITDIFLLIIFSTGILVIGYIFLQQIKLLKSINENLHKIATNHVVHDKQSQHVSTTNLHPVEYGLLKGEEFPELDVFNLSTRKVERFEINDAAENLILITGIGCQPCEEVLVKLSKLNSNQIMQKLIMFSFDPKISPNDVRQRHIELTGSISPLDQYVIDDKVLDKIKVNSFPTLLRVENNGKVLGAYSGHYEAVVNHIQFKSAAVVS